MSELEQLRREVNELRERLARLEFQSHGAPMTRTGLSQLIPQHSFTPEPCVPPPWQITCVVQEETAAHRHMREQCEQRGMC